MQSHSWKALTIASVHRLQVKHKAAVLQTAPLLSTTFTKELILIPRWEGPRGPPLPPSSSTGP